MISSLRCLIVLALFLFPPLVLTRVIHSPRMKRSLFSLLVSLWMGVQLFTLSVMFSTYKPLVIGGVLFIIALISGYPTLHFLYPYLLAQVERKNKR